MKVKICEFIEQKDGSIGNKKELTLGNKANIALFFINAALSLANISLFLIVKLAPGLICASIASALFNIFLYSTIASLSAHFILKKILSRKYKDNLDTKKSKKNSKKRNALLKKQRSVNKEIRHDTIFITAVGLIFIHSIKTIGYKKSQSKIFITNSNVFCIASYSALLAAFCIAKLIKEQNNKKLSNLQKNIKKLDCANKVQIFLKKSSARHF